MREARDGVDTGERTGPPDGLRRRLARRLHPDDRAWAIDEMDDLWALRAARDGVDAADRWYRGQTTRLPARLRADRLGRALRPIATREWWRTRTMTMDGVVRDLRYALRRLARAPGFSAVAVLSLALGIGANTAMFSIVNAVLIADPPFEDPSSLAEVYTSDSGSTLYGTWSYPDIVDLRERSAGVFEEITAARTFIAAGGDPSDPTVVVGEAVTPNHFTMLGVPMAAGRPFGPGEDGPSGSSPSVILNHGTWVREFGADPSVIGRTYRLNQLDYEIVGVAPKWYSGSFPAYHTQVFVPMNMVQTVMGLLGESDPLEARGNRSTFVRARLAEGMTVPQANAWLQSFAAGLEEAYPTTNRDRIYTAMALEDVIVHPIVDRALVPVAGFLMAIVGLVLLIACMNLASFLLARAEQRRREIAVRLSLGAGRGSLVRQLLVETLLLGALGGMGGIMIARWTVDALVSIRPPIPVPLNLDFPIDGNVLAFTLGISVLAGVLFGLVPALQATKPKLASTLREEGGAVTGSGRMRGILVVGQVSLSVVLLVGSALFMRSMLNAQGADPGFHHGDAAIIWPQLDLSGMTEEEGRAFWETLDARLLATPGVTHVGRTDMMPLGLGMQTTTVTIPGMTGERNDGDFEIDYAWSSIGFLDALDVEVLQGRDFVETDDEGGPTSMMVSRAFERRFFPDGAVGRTLDTGSGTRTIVGIVDDVKVRTIGEDPRPRMYFPATDRYLDGMQVLVRGTASSAELQRIAVDVAREVDPRVVLLDQRTMAEHLAVHLYPPRMAALLLSVFGGLALLLAAIGIWGVVSHAVARRTREVGIRVSMGATGGSIIRLLVGGGMRVVLAGMVIGLGLAAGAALLVRGFLYDVSTFDAVSFVGIPVLLGAVALGAAWLPARRAASVDPVRALRAE